MSTDDLLFFQGWVLFQFFIVLQHSSLLCQMLLRFWTATLSVATVVCAPAVASVSIYPTLQSPSEHPLYHKRCVQPPEYSAFGANGRSLSCLQSHGTDQVDQVSTICQPMDLFEQPHRIIWHRYAPPFFSNVYLRLPFTSTETLLTIHTLIRNGINIIHIPPPFSPPFFCLWQQRSWDYGLTRVSDSTQWHIV